MTAVKWKKEGEKKEKVILRENSPIFFLYTNLNATQTDWYIPLAKPSSTNV
jgi:hypothetical protein